MERPKMGFGIPLESWLSTELKDLVVEYLNPDKFSKHGLFNQQEVDRIVKGFFDGRKEWHLKIWHLLMFQMWYERWMK